MTHTCEEQRPLLVAYIEEELHAAADAPRGARGKSELNPLERARLESHLLNCSRCLAVKDQLTRSLKAAQSWVPEVDPEHFERMVHRLSPYLVERARPRFQIALAFAAAAAGLIIVLMLGRRFMNLEDPASTLPWTVANNAAPALAPSITPAPAVAPAPEAVIAAQPTPHIKMVTGGEWDGRVEQIDENTSEITMARGFAVVEFEGGHGRKLIVHAPGVAVDVVGTRFFVEVSRDGLHSVVGVKKGRVKATTHARVDFIDAGTSRAYAAQSGELSEAETPVRATAEVEHPFFGPSKAEPAEPAEQAEHAELAEHADPSPAKIAPASAPKTAPIAEARKPKPEPEAPAAPRHIEHPRHAATVPSAPVSAPAKTPAPAAGPASIDITRLLSRAESQVKRGQLDAALGSYRSVVEDTRPASAPYRPIAKLEMSRIYGFQLGKHDVAQRMLLELAHGSGEVATQASFALCELELSSDPCQASSCLRRLSDGSSGAEVTSEARLLLKRWGLEKLTCDHKSAAAPQPR